MRTPHRAGRPPHVAPLALAALLLPALAPVVAPAPGTDAPGGHALAAQEATEPYDIAIVNGRVIDPETGRDEVANVGIRGERIAVITTDDIRGRRTIDAGGHIVAPGFVDILSSIHPERVDHANKVADGVTTTFGMHGGPLDVEGYVAEQRAARPIVNYASTVDHRDAREAAGATDRYAPATPEQIEAAAELARQAIHDGAVGIGFGLNYSPGAEYEEVHAMFDVAAQEGVPAHLHARYKGDVFPLTMSLAAMEVVAMAAATGAQAQLAHLISSTVGSAPLSIALAEGAQEHGVDVGFDFHVWTRNQTSLQSALYDEGWQERFGGADYSDVYVSRTQERLDSARFHELRAEPEPISVQTEFIPEEEIVMGIESPVGIISSDGGGLVNGTGHPRSVGTFARFLGRYVREMGVVDWMEGLRKITVLPASRLEEAVPRMRLKGRLQVGADADVTVFDPETVHARATYANPNRRSAGIPWVLVNGVLVVDEGEVLDEPAPGQWLRHPEPGPRSSPVNR